MSGKQVNLTGAHHLRRNVLWNLLGTGAPLLVAIVAIPILIEGLGVDRFGVLMLSWMVVGYFSLFDLGLGRAVTKLVAEKLGDGRNSEIPGLIWTAMMLMAILGVLGAAAAAALSPWLVSSVLKIPSELQTETLTAFYLLSASISIVIITTGVRGILEAHQRFGLVNVVRIPLGISTFLGPVAVLPFTNSLVSVVVVLIFARFVALCVYILLCLKVEPRLRGSFSVNRKMAKSLLSFGGWLTVSNIVSPLMVYMDRFLIGAMITMTAVTYYATPYEVVTRFLVIPVALMGVLFPAFSTAFVQDKAHAARLYGRSVLYIFLSLFPAVLVIITFAREGLTMWLGSEFAGDSSVVLQLLAFGVLINSMAHVPFGLVQAAGRPDFTAKLHLLELPFYLILLWWLLSSYGIVGVAIAWVVRVVVDAFFLFVISHNLLSLGMSFTLRSVSSASLALSMLIVAAVIPDVNVKSWFLFVTLSIFVTLVWFVILAADEKKVLRRGLGLLYTVKQ